MNHLAHLLLTSLSGESLPGALMGDFVKGRLGGRYDEELRRAIQLHRRTDTFTDRHPRVCEGRRLFGPGTRRYAGIVMDVCYDHFLLRHWDRYARGDPGIFTRRAYAVLEAGRARMPPALRRALPGMIARDWLRACETLEGVSTTLERTLSRLSRRVPAAEAMAEVHVHYERLERGFLSFFPDAIAFAEGHPAGAKEDPLAAVPAARGERSPVPQGRGD